MPRYIDADECICNIEQDDTPYNEYYKMFAKDYVDATPTADVVNREDVCDAVDEALCFLNIIRANDGLNFDDYCELYDIISEICHDDENMPAEFCKKRSKQK